MKTMHILLAQIYCDILPQIRDTAKDLGYAIAVHGSLTRDFDLVAFPWSCDACDKDILVHAIIDTLHLSKVNKELSLQYEEKPHGRVSYAIQLGIGAYIDFSIFNTSQKLAYFENDGSWNELALKCNIAEEKVEELEKKLIALMEAKQ